MRRNISVEELKAALEKSGLPFGSSFDMKQAKLGARDAISSQVGDFGAGEKRKGLMAQLDQIAQMDKRLSGVYSDPTSNLYIENAAAREGAIYGRRGTDMAQVNDTNQSINDSLQQRDETINQTESLYDDLISAQGQLEAEEKRLTTQTKKKQTEVQKKSNTVKTESGNDFELSKQQARQARNAKVNLKDAKAVSEFFNKSTPAFRNYMEDEGIDGKIKNENLSAREIKELRMRWEKVNSDDKAKKAAETAAKKKQASSKTVKSDDFVTALQEYAKRNKK
jgi:hypothetical protein